MYRTHIAKQTFTQCTTLERRGIALLVVLCVAFSLLYGYFVTTSIVNVLARKELEHRIATLHSDIGKLESAYLARTNTIDMHFANSNGFVAVAETQYVTRQQLARSITASGAE